MSKKKLLSIPILFILLFTISGHSLTINPDNDTFVQSTDGVNVTHWNETFLVVGNGDVQAQFEYPENLQTIIKFNNSKFNNRIINKINFTAKLTVDVCSNPSFDGILFIRWINNDTWKDNITFSEAVTWTNRLNISLWDSTSNGSITSTPFNLNYTALMNDLYNNEFSSYIIDNFHSKCNGAGRRNIIDSIEGLNPENITILQSDYFTYQINSTAPNQNIYFDFESGNWSIVSFPEYDIIYNPSLNEFSPVGTSAVYQANNANSVSNDLDIVNCDMVASDWNYNIKSDINNPPGTYDTFCFNLTYAHEGKQFYGAIKIINNTNNKFDFHYALYSPSYNTFTTPVLTPRPAQTGLNLTIYWTTTQLLDTRLKYRYNISGNFTPYFSVEKYGNFTYIHSGTINGDFILPYYYEFYLAGNDSIGGNFTSSTYNFTPQSYLSIITNITENATIPGAIQDLVDNGLVPDTTTGLWLFGTMILLIGVGLAFYISGIKLALGVLVTLISVESLVGLLPTFILIPLIVLGAFIITKIVRSVLGSGSTGD